MKALAFAALAIAGYFALQLHKLGTGAATLARYAAFRLIDLATEFARLAAYIALALAIWYLINPSLATTRLSALWLALH